MGVSLCAKFQVCTTIFKDWWGGGGVLQPLSTSKQTPKNPTQVRVNSTFETPSLIANAKENNSS